MSDETLKLFGSSKLVRQCIILHSCIKPVWSHRYVFRYNFGINGRLKKIV